MTLESDTAANNGSNGVFAQGPPSGSSSISATAYLSNVTVTGNAGMGLEAAASSPQDGFLIALNSNNRAADNTGGDGAPTGNLFALHFVEALYLDDLGRAGTTTEMSGWVSMFESQGASAVANLFAHAPESLDHVVRGWYMTYLGRAASGGEEMVWVNQLAQGQTQEQVLADILGDPGHEFFNRAQTLVSSGTPNERYVQALYMLLLNRTGSASEIDGWANQIPQLGLMCVALQIQQSGEYRTDMVGGYYSLLLHRPAGAYSDQNGLASWVWMSGEDLYSIRTNFEGTPEFYVDG
jgi:hypothetical protein